MSVQWFHFLTAFPLIILLFTLCWVVSLKTKNAGIIDVCWALAIFLLNLGYHLVTGPWNWAKFLAFLTISLWSARLGYDLFGRYLSHSEDPRYTEIKQRWGVNDAGFFWMYGFQGTLIWLLSLPLLFIARTDAFSGWFLLGLVLSNIGWLGETVADRQLRAFKKSSREQKVLCSGLWKFSRHPNYFFEWVVWLGLFFMALPQNLGWLALFSTATMYLFLTRISGVPLTEERLKSKGPEFQAYVKRTPAFFPWFPAKEKKKENT